MKASDRGSASSSAAILSHKLSVCEDAGPRGGSHFRFTTW